MRCLPRQTGASIFGGDYKNVSVFDVLFARSTAVETVPLKSTKNKKLFLANVTKTCMDHANSFQKEKALLTNGSFGG